MGKRREFMYVVSIDFPYKLPSPISPHITLAGVHTWGARYRANYLPGLREPFKWDAVDLAPGAIERTDGVFSQLKSDTVFRTRSANRGREPSFTIFPLAQKKTVEPSEGLKLSPDLEVWTRDVTVINKTLHSIIQLGYNCYISCVINEINGNILK